MTDEEKRLRDIVITNNDLYEMLEKWMAADVEPLVVCTMAIMHFTSLSAELFDDENMHKEFVMSTVATGIKRYNQHKKEKHYVQ